MWFSLLTFFFILTGYVCAARLVGNRCSVDQFAANYGTTDRHPFAYDLVAQILFHTERLYNDMLFVVRHMKRVWIVQLRKCCCLLRCH